MAFSIHGVIPKPRVFTSGARDLARTATTLKPEVKRERLQ